MTQMPNDQAGSADQSSRKDSSSREEKGGVAGADYLIPGTPVQLLIKQFNSRNNQVSSNQPINQVSRKTQVSFSRTKSFNTCPSRIDNDTKEQPTETKESGFAVQSKVKQTWNPVKKLRIACWTMFGFNALIKTSSVSQDNIHAFKAEVWLLEIPEFKHDPIAVHVAASKRSAKREAARLALALLNADCHLVERYIHAFQTREVLFIAPSTHPQADVEQSRK